LVLIIRLVYYSKKGG